jgi:aldehyde:ferredoxin oxidoreductase
MPLPGYHGRYLRVDATTRSWDVVPIPDDVLARYIGGSGLATWILHAESSDRQEPFAVDAPVIFCLSPLVGTALTTSAKFAVACHSPLTGRINDSLSSSHFAIAAKKTGYDAIVLKGASRTPLAIVIEPGSVRFESAEDVWGQSSRIASDVLRSRLGAGFRLAGIGPAGENLVRYATVSHDGRHAGRGGTGAVLGAKRIKAIAVRGDRLAEVANPAAVSRYAKSLSEKSFGPATAKYRELGTATNLLAFNRMGTLPTRNFQGGEFAAVGDLAPESLTAAFPHLRESCAACTIGCEHLIRIDDNRPVRLEYENLFALGPLCGVSDPQTVLAASALCDELGLDTISAGGTIAFAMECAEKGLIDAPGLRFGSGEALLATLRAISAREGIGDLLAEGSRIASQSIGQNSAAFAPHVKGLEIPGYEPRALQLMALGFAVGTRGADHNRSGAYEVDFSDKVDRLHALPQDVVHAIATEDEAALMDSLILCKFLRGVFDDRVAAMAEMLSLVTGQELTADAARQSARAIITAKKWFNIRQGWTSAEDTLPERFLSTALPTGASSGATLTRERLNGLIVAYNLARGWSAEGWPPADTNPLESRPTSSV